MRIPLIAGNWKMNMTCESGKKLAKAIAEGIGDTDVEIAVCCPFPMLFGIADALRGTPIRLGAQNMHWEDSGAYTGEVSAAMLTEAGTTYVILGHSERRHVFGESDEWVQKKLCKAIESELVPILCIGETLEEREQEQTENVLEKQLEMSLKSVAANNAERIVIAYEPVWAIGTGKTATPQQAAEAAEFIRSWLVNKYDNEVSEKIRILYGGSVKPDNASEIMESEEIDGALVGGASLKVEDFIGIINF
ncbi:MAG: triose-phosphate isomerase [Tindallia sp. MSAO_Bac2]|nr:MAG: triose-phosphate isomerase [Tindallia sp. MSAO_Bac2]